MISKALYSTNQNKTFLELLLSNDCTMESKKYFHTIKLTGTIIPIIIFIIKIADILDGDDLHTSPIVLLKICICSCFFFIQPLQYHFIFKKGIPYFYRIPHLQNTYTLGVCASTYYDARLAFLATESFEL